jgi:hypothetical protein
MLDYIEEIKNKPEIKMHCDICHEDVSPVNEFGEPLKRGDEFAICPVCETIIGKWN